LATSWKVIARLNNLLEVAQGPSIFDYPCIEKKRFQEEVVWCFIQSQIKFFY